MKKILLILFLSTKALSQLTYHEGSFNFLKKENEVNVEFRYDSLTLTKAFLSEAQYIEERVKKLNTKYGEGKGEAWEELWITSRNSTWEPQFLDILSKTYKTKAQTTFNKNLFHAPYTLVVDVRWINPGWDVYVGGDITRVSAILSIVETTNREKVLTTTRIDKIDGSTKAATNFHGNEVRIGLAFARLANTFARRMKQSDPLFKTTKF